MSLRFALVDDTDELLVVPEHRLSTKQPPTVATTLSELHASNLEELAFLSVLGREDDLDGLSGLASLPVLDRFRDDAAELGWDCLDEVDLLRSWAALHPNARWDVG